MNKKVNIREVGHLIGQNRKIFKSGSSLGMELIKILRLKYKLERIKLLKLVKKFKSIDLKLEAINDIKKNIGSLQSRIKNLHRKYGEYISMNTTNMKFKSVEFGSKHLNILSKVVPKGNITKQISKRLVEDITKYLEGDVSDEIKGTKKQDEKEKRQLKEENEKLDKVRKMSKDLKMNVIDMFVGNIVKNGKRISGELIMFDVLDYIRKDPILRLEDKTPVEVILMAVENVRPRMDLKPKTIGGMVYRIPHIIKNDSDYHFAVRSIVSCARERVHEKSFSLKLFNEILESYRGKGKAVEKKNGLHDNILASRPFLKFL